MGIAITAKHELHLVCEVRSLTELAMPVGRTQSFLDCVATGRDRGSTVWPRWLPTAPRDDFRKRGPERTTRRLVAQLEALGHKVTLEPSRSGMTPIASHFLKH